MRTAVLVALAMLASAAAAAGDGLKAAPDLLGVPRWQPRLELDSTASRPDWAGQALGQAGSVQTARLLGDYHLDTLRLGQTGGLRLTGGLLLSQRSLSIGAMPQFGMRDAIAESRSTWPYLGLGYFGAGARGDWGFSADIGLAAQSLGATVSLGRVLNGGLSVNDALRELRLQPVVRLGVTYSF